MTHHDCPATQGDDCPATQGDDCPHCDRRINRAELARSERHDDYGDDNDQREAS